MALCDRLEAEQSDATAAHERLVATLLGTLTQSTDAADLAANWQRLAEHFDTLFTTESSLDALKQTILQLAVMGKLVPQDPNDEPASELLKRIAKERARLEAEGNCKKSKPMPLAGRWTSSHLSCRAVGHWLDYVRCEQFSVDGNVRSIRVVWRMTILALKRQYLAYSVQIARVVAR